MTLVDFEKSWRRTKAEWDEAKAAGGVVTIAYGGKVVRIIRPRWSDLHWYVVSQFQAIYGALNAQLDRADCDLYRMRGSGWLGAPYVSWRKRERDDLADPYVSTFPWPWTPEQRLRATTASSERLIRKLAVKTAVPMQLWGVPRDFVAPCNADILDHLNGECEC